MPNTNISYRDTNYFNSLFCDYIEGSDHLSPFYNNKPNIDNFKNQILSKKENFKSNNRLVLRDILLKQYASIGLPDDIKKCINLIADNNTFTVTTGHQLCLFTGPLYFLYKIISTINLTEELKLKYPEFNFIPIYWMATEDHDFDEIRSFKYGNENITWDSNQKGQVGNFSTVNLKNSLDKLSKLLPNTTNSSKLIKLFNDSYIKSNNLTEATRKLVHELFKNYKLVILDSNEIELKKIFSTTIKNELINSFIYKNSLDSLKDLKEKKYKIQVNPREINLFYLSDNYRSRIIRREDNFFTEDQKYLWTKNDIIKELETNPENFSPNVLLRPLFQETILPNICYIGGGSEIAYWLELKNCFDQQNLTFPILLNRNSVLLVNSKQLNKLNKTNTTIHELFLNQNELLSNKTKSLASAKFNFNSQKVFLEKQFNDLRQISKQTDFSFVGAVNAQEKKQIKGLLNLEKRLLKANKRKYKSQLEKITSIQNELFPNYALQERSVNFIKFYLDYGDSFIEILKENILPLNNKFTIIELKNN
ncbi:bacillithiol biosynthesis cysteine-adding enzyme BshC [Flavobacteriaceae bacterium]|nr:bacillithiol biosynthesis cysteine-adding enzyme BshC [Flavobacteriaceae bacterium]